MNVLSRYEADSIRVERQGAAVALHAHTTSGEILVLTLPHAASAVMLFGELLLLSRHPCSSCPHHPAPTPNVQTSTSNAQG